MQVSLILFKLGGSSGWNALTQQRVTDAGVTDLVQARWDGISDTACD